MGVFYMFLSESDYDSLCTFPLQLSWGPHSQFSHLQIISCAILWPHSQFFSFADYLCAIFVTTFALFFICRLSPLYTCDRIRNFSYLQIISCAILWPHSHFFSFADYLCSILVTAFVIFPICRLSPAPYLWPHSHFFSFADYLLLYICDRIRNFSYLQIIFFAILVTAFPFFPICRLSPAPYLWPHSQLFSFADYLRSILVTAFALFPICRLSLLYTCDCICNFSHL